MVSVTIEARRKSLGKMPAGGFFEAVIPHPPKEPLTGLRLSTGRCVGKVLCALAFLSTAVGA